MLSQFVSGNYSGNWELLRNSSFSFILHLQSSARFVSLSSAILNLTFSLHLTDTAFLDCVISCFTAVLSIWGLPSILQFMFSFEYRAMCFKTQIRQVYLYQSPSKASYCFQEKRKSVTPHGGFTMIWPALLLCHFPQHEHNELLTSVILDILCHHCFCVHYSLQHPLLFSQICFYLADSLYTRYR